MENSFKHVAENVRREIESITNKAGLLCRVFARGKSNRSLRDKINREEGKYCVGGRLVQDAIGIRVALYFEEDVDVVTELISSHFSLDTDSSTIDAHANDQFKVTRHNLILKIPEHYAEEMRRAIHDLPVDLTFEVQLRSVLSEGWHEVDHDLRYKSKSSWIGQDDLSRALNGILATLETAEWSMRRIFDDLAYRHYKAKNWEQMLHTKIRMRVEPKLSGNLLDVLDADNEFAKHLFRINRKRVIRTIAKMTPSIPLSLDNIAYVWNYLGPRQQDVLAFTPVIIMDALVSSESIESARSS